MKKLIASAILLTCTNAYAGITPFTIEDEFDGTKKAGFILTSENKDAQLIYRCDKNGHNLYIQPTGPFMHLGKGSKINTNWDGLIQYDPHVSHSTDGESIGWWNKQYKRDQIQRLKRSNSFIARVETWRGEIYTYKFKLKGTTVAMNNAIKKVGCSTEISEDLTWDSKRKVYRWNPTETEVEVKTITETEVEKKLVWKPREEVFTKSEWLSNRKFNKATGMWEEINKDEPVANNNHWDEED